MPPAGDERGRGPSISGRRPQPGLPDFETSAAVHTGGVTDHDGRVADRVTIDGALSQLPEEFRLPVMLRDLCDLDYAEIADTLAIPPGTVRSRIFRARDAIDQKLRPLLSDAKASES